MRIGNGIGMEMKFDISFHVRYTNLKFMQSMKKVLIILSGARLGPFNSCRVSELMINDYLLSTISFYTTFHVIDEL